MRYCVQWVTLVVLSCCLLASTTTGSCAYIDAGTGSYLLQVLAATVFAGLFVVKVFWRNIKEFVAHLVGKRPKQ